MRFTRERPSSGSAEVRPVVRVMVSLLALGLAATTTVFVVGAFHRAPLYRPRGDASSTSPTSADASSIYYRAESNDGASLIGSVAPDGTNNHIIFPPDSPTRLTFASTAFDPSIEFCHPGVYADCPTAIYVMGSDGSDARRVTDQPEDASSSAWSPDGRRLAFFASGDAAPTAIYVVNADGSRRTMVTSSRGGSDMWPSWSPTGDTVVFGGIHWEDWGVFAVNADGTNERSLLGANGTYAAHPRWSPDGTDIAFGGEVANSDGIYLMRPDGSGLTRIASPPAGFFVQEIAWRPLPVTASVTGTFDVGLTGQVSGLAYGFGSLWVDGYESPIGPGHVMRLDAQTGEQLADILIGGVAPGFEVGGGGIVVGAGAVWVLGSSQASGGVDAVLVRIDPTTNRVVDTIDLGGKVADDVTVDENGVWALFGGDDDRMVVGRFDPATNQVVGTISLDQRYGHFIFSFGNTVVAMTNETTDTAIGNSVVNVIDPSTNTVTNSVSLGEYLWPAAGHDMLWTSTGTTLERIDPSSGDVVGTWPLESTGDALSVGAGGVWSVSPRGGRRTISRWNPVSAYTDLTIDLPPGAGANVMTTSTDAVWVLGFDGAITRIQLSSN